MATDPVAPDFAAWPREQRLRALQTLLGDPLLIGPLDLDPAAHPHRAFLPLAADIEPGCSRAVQVAALAALRPQGLAILPVVHQVLDHADAVEYRSRREFTTGWWWWKRTEVRLEDPRLVYRLETVPPAAWDVESIFSGNRPIQNRPMGLITGGAAFSGLYALGDLDAAVVPMNTIFTVVVRNPTAHTLPFRAVIVGEHAPEPAQDPHAEMEVRS